MSQIHITDGQTDRILATITARNILHDEHRKSLKDTLETYDFETFADKKFSSHLGKHNRVVIPDEDGTYQEFVIHGAGKYRGPDGFLKAEVYTSASYLLLKKAGVIAPQTLSAQTPSTAVGFACYGTEWQPGVITFAGVRTIHIESHTNPFALLKRIANEFGLELRFRIEIDGNKIIGRFVDLLPRVGQWSGREVEFGRDLITIERKENTDNLVTALVGLGPEREDGTRLEVFVEDKDALARWGKEGRHFVETYEPQTSDENMTLERFTQLTQMELNKRVNAIVEYKGDVADLEHVPGMANKKIRFADTIKIKDTMFNPPLYLEARVHTMVRSIKDKSKKHVELGDYIEYTEAEVNAVWKGLQVQIRQKVSMLDVLEVTYTKETIDSKDESVYHDSTHYSDVVSNTAKEEAIDTAAQDATEKANQAEDNAKSHAEIKAQEAQSAAEAFAEIEAEAKRVLAEAYADGKVTTEEQARINDVQARLLEAQQYAEIKASEAEQAASQYAEQKATQAENNAKEHANQKATEAENKAKQYSQAEIQATEQAILSTLNGRIGDIQSDIGDLQFNLNQDIANLQDTASDLLYRATELESDLLEAGGRIVHVEQNVDTLNGKIDMTITQLSSLDGVVSEQQTTLQYHAGQINAKAERSEVITVDNRVTGVRSDLSSLEIAYDGISTNVSSLRSDLEEIEGNITSIQAFASSIDQKADLIATNVSGLTQTVNGHTSQINSAQTQINQNTTAIGFKAEQSQVNTIAGQVSSLNTRAGDLEVGVNGILGRVSNTETSINGLTGELNLAKSQIANLDVRADGISASVSEIQDNLGSLGGRVTTAEGALSVLPGQIDAKASQTEVNSLTGRMSQAESSLSVHANQISAKVDVDGVIAAFNLSPETAKLQANRIELVGAVTVLSDIAGNLGTVTAGVINGVDIYGSNFQALYTGTDAQFGTTRLINDGLYFNESSDSGTLYGSTQSETSYRKDGYSYTLTQGGIGNIGHNFDTTGLRFFGQGSWMNRDWGLIDKPAEQVVELYNHQGEIAIKALNGVTVDSSLQVSGQSVFRSPQIMQFGNTENLSVSRSRITAHDYRYTNQAGQLSSVVASIALENYNTGGTGWFDVESRRHVGFAFYTRNNGTWTTAFRIDPAGNFFASGSKSAVVDTDNYGKRAMYATESTQNWFFDVMDRKLQVGKWFIGLNPMFMEMIADEYFVKVFTQNQCTIQMIKREKNGFYVDVATDDVAEVVFEVYGNRKGYEYEYMEEVA